MIYDITKMSSTQYYRRIKTVVKSLKIKGIIFDMDGTLTIPVLNFCELRQKLNLKDDGTDILQFAETADEDEKPRILKIISDFEKAGTENLKLQPNLHKMFYYLKDNSIKRALLTRNNKDAVDVFIKRFLEKDTKQIFSKESDIFSQIITRDFVPVKPNPAAVHHICSEWDLSEENVLVVGDDVKDIECGNRAGAVTILLTNSKNECWKKIADRSISDLSELITLLQQPFDVVK